jgi:uncharacterized integral membrane protein
MLRLGLMLAAIVLAVVFAAQNADVVNLSFLAWNLDASLAVIIVLCFAVGALIAVLAMAPGLYRDRSERRKLNQRLAQFEHRDQPSSDQLSSADSDSGVLHHATAIPSSKGGDTSNARVGGI